MHSRLFVLIFFIVAMVVFQITLFGDTAKPWSTMDGMTDEAITAYYQRCPFGDGVLIHRQNKAVMIDVSCVNYDSEKKVWIVSKEEHGSTIQMEFPVDDWEVSTMDYHLKVEKEKIYRKD